MSAGSIALLWPRFGSSFNPVNGRDEAESLTASILEESATIPPSQPRPTKGSQFYAASDGHPGGDGSKKRPWDLATALAQPRKVKPGDTIWLQGGKYKGEFKSTLRGSEMQTILVGQAANERATIDGSLTVEGAWTTFWGFEVMNSSTDRANERLTGVDVYGPNMKFINLVVHDCGNGFGFWSSAVDSELYGNIIFNNGWQGLDRGHGHAIYAQNEEGTKVVRDNIAFNQFGLGIHAYAEKGALNGLHFAGNVSFNNGAATEDGARYTNILVGGHKPAERITLIGNLTYNTLSKRGSKPNVRLDYAGSHNKDLTMKDNYFAGGDIVASVRDWEVLAVTGNTFYGAERLLELAMPQDLAASGSYTWNHNSYHQIGRDKAFSLQGRDLDFSDWRKATGFDQNSDWVDTGRSPETKIFIRKNEYEPERASIVVYNWELKNIVDVDVNSLLRVGTKYEVRNAQNYFGSPVIAGTFDGRPLRLPMTGLRVTAPIGLRKGPEPTSPLFNVFIIIQAS